MIVFFVIPAAIVIVAIPAVESPTTVAPDCQLTTVIPVPTDDPAAFASIPDITPLNPLPSPVCVPSKVVAVTTPAN